MSRHNLPNFHFSPRSRKLFFRISLSIAKCRSIRSSLRCNTDTDFLIPVLEEGLQTCEGALLQGGELGLQLVPPGDFGLALQAGEDFEDDSDYEPSGVSIGVVAPTSEDAPGGPVLTKILVPSRERMSHHAPFLGETVVLIFEGWRSCGIVRPLQAKHSRWKESTLRDREVSPCPSGPSASSSSPGSALWSG